MKLQSETTRTLKLANVLTLTIPLFVFSLINMSNRLTEEPSPIDISAVKLEFVQSMVETQEMTTSDAQKLANQMFTKEAFNQ
ncbi:hypothetical protein [Vibrio sp. 1CM23M]|uniref:hypothetical protein n=1 Tax=Vibrio sp. 1CM23M TaxID=2929164 RepID=UPI0020BEE014|nr:hypothetical protein [Vibrio sp. 1CM23M]MCK8072422.1 hypothetical protein [Vibrio sp. 1CM23M]